MYRQSPVTRESLPSLFFKPTDRSVLNDYESIVNIDDTYLDAANYLHNTVYENQANIPEHEKWQIIDQWLNDLYKDTPLPLFERNPDTAAALYEMALFNKEQDAAAELVRENRTMHRIEYVEEDKRLQEILKVIGISKNDLSKNGECAIRTLSSLAITLGLGDVEQSSYFRALAQLNIDSERTQRSRNMTKRTIEEFENQIQEASLRLERLNTNKWDFVEEQKLKEWKKNSCLLTRKSCEYGNRLLHLQKQYESMGVEEGGLRIENLKQIEKNVEALGELLETKRQKLQIYQEMPPDLQMAQLKLDHAREALVELRETEAELAEAIAETVQ
ncbi:10584_t:CDS:2 [Paraglomus brasilianum]|uniref:10584_t:CDS:1 n=1 Tax=Paraglomus brasilianum TaxID=144538 RepID=A0A9N9FYG2_9GLOM|nr:10584_t:CDS:2 [Paraglomus brasilianum]